MSKINAYELAKFPADNGGMAHVHGHGWMPMRPMIATPISWFWRDRIREAWLVLAGKRHTVVFPGQEPDDHAE